VWSLTALFASPWLIGVRYRRGGRPRLLTGEKLDAVKRLLSAGTPVILEMWRRRSISRHRPSIDIFLERGRLPEQGSVRQPAPPACVAFRRIA